ncbi:hypothetical protein B0I35DRAFT_427613 [Stachybotrys elegans]|uniref:Fe2OG dioxygenase domain-containing protein n=1 Tax=Stachybotrys elegans TaxID=80388 RepID=A0A8K0SRH3_9HYPO|nr:hypothetical protein B0I35DRAFT_427613 [Stachybotrys elegans]
MSTVQSLDIIDISSYIDPKSAGDQERVITQVYNACRLYGFFQVKGHGIPLATQRAVIQSSQELFAISPEQKLKMSFLKNVVRRGYEQSGDSIRDSDELPDTKESFFVGREEPVIEAPGWHGPNVWPDPHVLPADTFRNPVWEYYQATNQLGRTIWEILLRGLGFESPEEVMARFTKKPVVTLKLIRSPPQAPTPKGVDPSRFSTGAHTDFGGVTCLLQQPGRDGLEIWNAQDSVWIDVPTVEDVLVINVGDLIHDWSGGVYKSVRHRAINKSSEDRISCATFWLGDVHVRNPLNPESSMAEETVGERLYKRLGKQYGLWGVMDPIEYSTAAKTVEATCVVQ